MSPRSVTNDRITKPAVYARAGIPHFWRIERDADGITVLVHRLVGEVYTEVGVFRDEEEAVVTDPVSVRFRPRDLLV